MRIVFLLLLLSSFSAHAEIDFQKYLPPDNIWSRIHSDYSYYYHSDYLARSGALIAVGATLANTGLDKDFQHHWQRKIRTHDHDNILRPFQDSGEGAFAHLPLFIAAIVFGQDYPADQWQGKLGLWGDHAIRIWALGGPQQILLTNIFGGERPGTGSRSNWKPFHGYRGVSGHAFFGAVPYLAAMSVSESNWAKATFLSASLLPGLARVNNDFHYLSQAVMGWGFAYLATSAVMQTKDQMVPNDQSSVVWIPMPIENGMLLGIQLKF